MTPKDTRARRHSSHLGIWTLRRLSTRALERHLGTQALKHLGTLDTRSTLSGRLILSRCDEDISICQGKLYTTCVTFFTESLGILYDQYKANKCWTAQHVAIYAEKLFNSKFKKQYILDTACDLRKLDSFKKNSVSLT